MKNDKNMPPDTLKEGNTPVPANEIDKLHAQVQDMQMEIDILKETINALKKDPGIDQSALKNREKAVIVDALKDKYSLPSLLNRLSLPKSSYYYQKEAFRKEDKYSLIRRKIKELFHENAGRFDDLVVSWTIGINPDAALANGMLDRAVSRLGKGEHPVIHSDRGCHYRWPGWIRLMEQEGLERSMSKKGCSPENSACEGLYDHEMF